MPRSETRLRDDAPQLLVLVACAVTFYLAPWPLVYIPALTALLGLALLWPRLALALVPLFAPLFMQPKHLGAERFAPSEVFLLVAFVGAAAPTSPLWDDPREAWLRVRLSPFLAPLALLLVSALVSSVFAADRHQALQYLRLVVIEPVVFYLLLTALLTTERDWWHPFAAAVAGGIAVGIVGLVQQITQQGLGSVPGTSILHIRSVYGSPNNIGLFYDRVVPVWLAFLLFLPVRRLLWVGQVALGCVLLSTLFLTASRGAWAAVALGCIALLAVRFSWGKWFALVILVVGVVVIGLEGQRVVHAFGFGHKDTASRRVDIWRSSWQMIRHRPLTGVGPDNFLHYYAPPTDKYSGCPPGLGYVRPGAVSEPCESHPHDEFLDFYLSTGPLGLVAFLWIQALFWTRARPLWRAPDSALERALLAGTAAGMLAAVAHGLVDNSYFLIDLSILFWLFVGYVTYLTLRGETVGEATVAIPPARAHGS
ncbi:MAG: O-antigen ligase family protein [Chloroflexota bacterium]